ARDPAYLCAARLEPNWQAVLPRGSHRRTRRRQRRARHPYSKKSKGTASMPIKVGDKIPSVKLKTMTKDGMKEMTTDEIFGRGKTVMFALPGAFTPTCSAKHLPGFVGKAEDIRKKGVSKIACLSVNDAFVMNAWGKDQNVGDKVLMLADGNAEFTK